MSDNYTPHDESDDVLASFSSAGPTFEGFVKPELVAPAGHILSIMLSDAKIVLEHPEYYEGSELFAMSGTSQATGIVSGIAALIRQQNPLLTPDDEKCRLINTAKPAVNPINRTIPVQSLSIVCKSPARFHFNARLPA